MNEPTMNNMAQRIDRLERGNRRMKRIGAVVLVGVATVFLMGQAKPSKVAKVIEAEKFILRDKNGIVRASLTIGENGVTALGFTDEEGKTRIVLGVWLGKPGLVLQDKQEQKRVELTGPDYGIYLFDQNGRNRTVLGMKEGTKGSPGLWLNDKDGKNRAALTLKEDGSPTFGLYDKSGAVLTQEPSTTRPSGPMWVLWSQTGDLSLPISAWPTKNECEAQIGGGHASFPGQRSFVGKLPPGHHKSSR